MKALDDERVPVEAADPLRARLVGFVRFLRENGFTVGVSEGLDALVVAEHAGPMNRQRLHWGLRALLCSNAEQWARFDALFDAYWRRPNRAALFRSEGGGRLRPRARPPSPAEGTRGAGVDSDHGGEGDGDGGGESRGGASAQESLARRDFRFLHDGREIRELEELAERLAKRMRRRHIRRQRIGQHGRRVHLRRTLRRSLCYGGLPFRLAYRVRRRPPPRLVLLLDVSRSMNLYSYFFLRFARGLVAAFQDTHAFVLHTRLVHVTDALKERERYRLKEKLVALSEGWAGGTRIGDCLRTFNRDYARRLVGGRSVVVVLSDGLDTGEAALLGDEMERLRRRARRVVWLNPLLGREGYEPRAGGMQAALPHVDLFAPAHNLESLAALEPELTGL